MLKSASTNDAVPHALRWDCDEWAPVFYNRSTLTTALLSAATKLFAVPMILSSASLAHADITYTLDLHGPNGTATGTITTDGVTGVLGSGDIVSYNIAASSPTGSVTITTGVFGVLGNDLTATATSLFYNFSDTTNLNYLGLADPAFSNYICYSGTRSCGELSAPGLDININGSAVTNSFTANLEIAAVAAPVPEPSSAALLRTGVLGLIGAARHKGHKA